MWPTSRAKCLPGPQQQQHNVLFFLYKTDKVRSHFSHFLSFFILKSDLFFDFCASLMEIVIWFLHHHRRVDQSCTHRDEHSEQFICTLDSIATDTKYLLYLVSVLYHVICRRSAKPNSHSHLIHVQHRNQVRNNRRG